jgi:hypothetical protein
VVHRPPRTPGVARLLIVIVLLGMCFAFVAGWLPLDQYSIGLGFGVMGVALILDR